MADIARHRSRPPIGRTVLGALAVLALLLALGSWLYTELLWHREVGFSEVYTTRLRTQLLLFAVAGGVFATIVGANVVVAHRLRPPFRPDSLEQRNLDRYRIAIDPIRRLALIGATSFLGIVAGVAVAGRWQTWLAWRNAVPFGVEDPQFGRDVSYYAFTYPMQRLALGFLFGALIAATLAAAGTHYLYGGIRLQTRGEKVVAPARAHLSVLLGLIVLLKAIAYYIDQFGLNFSPRGVVTGAAYADVNATLPSLRILAVIALICSLLFFANIRSRGWALPATGVGLLLFSAVVIGGVYPWAIQQFRVKPNEVDLEEPYIQRNIEATRRAYRLDGVEYRDFAGSPTVTAAQVAADRATLPNARLLDPNVLQPTFEQLQQIRGYYGFSKELDIDRYTVDGRTQDYVVAVRQLDREGLGDQQQRSWINQHLQFTHGYGFVAAPANAAAADGQPAFAVRDIDSRGPIPVRQPRVYYGELPMDYSIVGTTQQEIDRPSEGSETEAQRFTYDGKGGVPMGSFARRLMYAVKFRDRNLLLSGAIGERSRILYVRDPAERVHKVAPYLQLDRDPYPAVVDGRILWIVDGYTTSDGFPYSQRVPLGDVTVDSRGVAQPALQINYIRNSVKATVDAYDGTVTLYRWDEEDPVLSTWGKVFPNSLTPRSEMSPELLAHVRYPEDLFKVQRSLLTRYHIGDARALFSEEDFWEVANDPNAQDAAGNPLQNVSQPPFYLLFQMPGTQSPGYYLTTALVARNRPNLAAFVAVSSDAADYGTIRLLRLPKNTVIPGPFQAGGNFKSDPTASPELSLLDQRGSKVIYGNLLALPVGESIMYVQPVYLQATSGARIPLLRKVFVGLGEKVGYGNTLQEALRQVVGGAPPPPRDPGTPPPPPADGDAELQAAIDEIARAYDAGQEALRRGDFAAYGEAQRRLQAAIERAQRASSPSASPAPSPSG